MTDASVTSVPRVTVAIPLYRSRRFVERIVSNVEAIDYPNVEVIISDRHVADDAIDIISERFRNDHRVRTLKASDRLNWVQHYSWLLQQASGRYFLWMPHDDQFPRGYVSQLVACLESHPDAVLAYGRIEPVDLDGRPIIRAVSRARPPVSTQRWSPRVALGLIIRRQLEEPFRGVFRRDVVIDAGLLIPATLEDVSADMYWVFALGLLGQFRFVPDCFCMKSYYPASTHASWGPAELRHLTDGHRVLLSYVRRYVRDRREARHFAGAIHLWLLLGILGVTARRCGIPAGLRRSVQQFLSDAITLD